MERIQHHGLSLRRNPGGDRTLLYIHGLGESGLCFERLMSDPRLAAWTHLCPDLPGYGASPWPTEPCTLEQLADLLARWITACGTGPVAVLGHSMGGVVGLLLCERHPGLVRGLLNVEGNISPDDCGYSSQAAALDRRTFLEHGMAGLLDRLYAAGQRDPAVRDYFVSARICDPRAYHLNSQELVQLSASGELAPRLAACPVPVLYLLGDPRGTGPRSRAQLDAAGVRWRAVPDAGHWPFADHPERFVDEALPFLRGLEGAPR